MQNFQNAKPGPSMIKADGMPRHYALIRKFQLLPLVFRITYLEPEPEDEKEIRWFEEELPVSVGNFSFTKKRRNLGVIQELGYKLVFRASDSHRKYEYDIVEILSNTTTTDGVSVAILHKAKGFASVFFRMDAEVIQIPSHSLYRFSHSIRSFKMKRVDVKGVPKDAYELDQAALPKAAIEERVVPPHLYADPKPEALSFPNKGKVFKTGQIWSFYSGDDTLPLYYCRINKITLIQAFGGTSV
ncbi:hypothetical protein Rs2_44937 [Raphanus sativus]|nr:hypothetical protein Rs2_44937 [Raphanus sativus]